MQPDEHVVEEALVRHRDDLPDEGRLREVPRDRLGHDVEPLRRHDRPDAHHAVLDERVHLVVGQRSERVGRAPSDYPDQVIRDLSRSRRADEVADDGEEPGEGRRIGPTRPSADPTRDRILAAAVDLFAERSFDGATTREIAARAGVAQPLLNYHYRSKDELWRAAVDSLFESLTSSMTAHLEELRDVDELTTRQAPASASS